MTVFAMVSLLGIAPCQAGPDSELVIMTMDELILKDMEDEDGSLHVAEDLDRLREHPLDLNSASADELIQVPGLDPVLARAIVEHRSSRRFPSVEDVLFVRGMTADVFLRIRTFLTVLPLSNSPGADDREWSLRARTGRDLQTREGYRSGVYAGSSQFVLMQGRFSQTVDVGGVPPFHVDAGGTVEKDAGERPASGFVAGFLRAKWKDSNMSLYVGDFTIGMGAGVIVGRPGARSGGRVGGMVSPGEGPRVRPYASAGEDGFFRGMAFEWVDDRMRAIVFASHRRRSGTLRSDGTVTSIGSSGLYRTDSELRRRHVVTHRTMGIGVEWQGTDRWMVGGKGVMAYVSRPLTAGRGLLPQNAPVVDFGFHGRWTSTFAALTWEVGNDAGGRWAWFSAAVIRPQRGADVTISARGCSPGFSALHGTQFAVGGEGGNDRDLGIALRHVIAPRWRGGSSFDRSYVPGRTLRSALVPGGSHVTAWVEGNVSRQWGVRAEWRLTSRSESATVPEGQEREVEQYGTELREMGRCDISWTSGAALRSRTRVEVVMVQGNGRDGRETGYLAYQDLKSTSPSGMSVAGRVVVFDAPSFRSRLYQFEGDLKGTFSNPPMYGRGMRWYVMVRIPLSSHVFCSAKYAHTVKDGVKFLASGSQRIDGNVDNHLRFQLDLQP